MASQQYYVQATVSPTDHAITFPWQTDQVTITASGDLHYVFGSSIPAASGLFLQAAQSPMVVSVQTTTMRVAAVGVDQLITVGILAERWDAREVMTQAHPQRDILGWERKTTAATRVGSAADGDT